MSRLCHDLQECYAMLCYAMLCRLGCHISLGALEAGTLRNVVSFARPCITSMIENNAGVERAPKKKRKKKPRPKPAPVATASSVADPFAMALPELAQLAAPAPTPAHAPPGGKRKQRPAEHDEVDASAFENTSVSCRDCGESFVFTAREQALLVQRGFPVVKTRCEGCAKFKRNRYGAKVASASELCATQGGDGESDSESGDSLERELGDNRGEQRGAGRGGKGKGKGGRGKGKGGRSKGNGGRGKGKGGRGGGGGRGYRLDT